MHLKNKLCSTHLKSPLCNKAPYRNIIKSCAFHHQGRCEQRVNGFSRNWGLETAIKNGYILCILIKLEHSVTKKQNRKRTPSIYSKFSCNLNSVISLGMPFYNTDSFHFVKWWVRTLALIPSLNDTLWTSSHSTALNQLKTNTGSK